MGLTLMKNKEEQEQFPAKEAAKRFEAALRGARLAGHVPMKPKEQIAAKKPKPKKRPGK
jgi:hypothetical protein